MIDSQPRLLPRPRLERLVHGLRERMTSSTQKMADEIVQLNEQMQLLEARHQVQLQKSQADRAETQAATTNQWDEILHSQWDDAELSTFKAVFETSSREGQMRAEARKSCDLVTQEAKKRVAEIEARFLRAKDVPIRRLHEFRANNLNFMGELLDVESAADAALAQMSIAVPKVTLEEFTSPTPTNSDECLRMLRAVIADAKIHYDHLTHHPLVKFFESIWIWVIAGLVFILTTAAVNLLGNIQILHALVGSLIVTIILVVVSLIGIRPWLKRLAAAEYPRVKQLTAHGKQLHDLGNEFATIENDNELKRLAKKRDDRFQQAAQWRESEIHSLTVRLDEDLDRLRREAEKQKHTASQMLTSRSEATRAKFVDQLALEADMAKERDASLRRALAESSDQLQSEIDRLSRGGALRLRTATQKAIQTIARSQQWCQRHFPDWLTALWSSNSWPEQLTEPVLPIGTLPVVSMLQEEARLALTTALSAEASNEANALSNRLESDTQAPVLFTPIQDGYLTITGDPNLPIVQQTVRNLILRALTTLPPGRTQVCVIDPPGLGRDYGWLMHLGDYDPQLVSHRVWTQPGHISKQVLQLAQAAEDFIQQSLRNQYKNIVEYNRDAGSLAEPFRILVWSSMPSGMDDQSWKGMQSLLDTGARCGIIPILLIDPAAQWPYPDQLEIVKRRGLHFVVSADGKTLESHSPVVGKVPVKPLAMPSEDHAQLVIQEVGRRAQLASRVEVPLANIAPAGNERWKADSSTKLEIPIGQSGVGRVHSLKLGVGTAQHAIVAGKTGSGKSSLLHAIITSALVKYSPENLRLVLLDFKKGVEFQIYANSQIPHADIIGIESHREFGLSALEYIDGCMQRRGELFRGQGVQDIASWNMISPDQHLPRMLLVVDEFQELFVEDDKLSGQASLILDRIVRQGRSFGIHAILSSQTLAGAYSLPRTTLGQMAVRIALQCDASDAQIIFAEDNPAAARLKHPGQAVYNDAGGRIEGNQPMQIGWLGKQQQQEWLTAIGHGYSNADPTTNILGRAVVYDGNRPATWNTPNADRAIANAKSEVNPEACWCVVGESVAISPAITFPLTNQAGRNLLIVGSKDETAASVMHTVTASFVRNHIGKTRPKVVALQGGKPTDGHALELPSLWKEFPCDFHVSDIRNVDEILKQLARELKERIDGGDEKAAQPILINIIQLGRFRSLRREDEFAMSSFNEDGPTADKCLEEILRDGPNHNIHVVAWLENYSTANRWLSRSSMREFEVRALMQMSANDSTNLIDTVAASRLGDNVMLINDEAVGQSQGFRPFGFDSVRQLKDWAGAKAS
jgi:DNA segregation ATPase FtsK/SpoIIIE, S-DNA-T family